MSAKRQNLQHKLANNTRHWRVQYKPRGYLIVHLPMGGYGVDDEAEIRSLWRRAYFRRRILALNFFVCISRRHTKEHQRDYLFLAQNIQQTEISDPPQQPKTES
uniref:Uncharacterized protein n=1 Tax=Photinus pyralis TaxID=7054 RepID=A0A1Y1N0N6_PHOPY